MPEHMRMSRKRKLSGLAGALDHSQEPTCCYWSASFGHEYIRTVALEWPQGSEFRTVQRMHSLLTALHPIDRGCPAFLLNIEKRSLPRLMLSGDGLASKDAV